MIRVNLGGPDRSAIRGADTRIELTEMVYTAGRELPVERAVLAGRGHAVQMTGEPFNERLAAFIEAAEAAR